MGKQLLDADDQPVLSKEHVCAHGVYSDDRGNNACEACADSGRTARFLLGIAVGWEEVQEWALKQSGEEYAKGNDARASMFRELAKSAKETSRERRKAFESFELENPKGLLKKAS